MTPDHYATLGVSPTSEDVVIRAAYLALMRRYHPDLNSSAEAAQRAQAITSAYAVLGNWRRRSEYDLKRAQLSAHRMPGAVAPRRPRPSASALFALAAVGLLVLVVIRPPLLVGELPEPQPAAALTRNAAALKPNPAAHCGSSATTDRIKRELFRRAAEIRGRDQRAFDRIAGFSHMRINLPELRQADAKLGTVRCQAWVELDLPPGLAVLDGRRNLMADIRYTVKPGAGDKSSVSLSNEGLIVTPLVTLAQISRDDEPSPKPVARPPAEALPVDEPPLSPILTPPPPRARVAPQHARTAQTHVSQPPAEAELAKPVKQAGAPTSKPSYSCQIAKGRGETAVCKSSDLSRLDRHLGMLYGQSWGQADATRRARLLGTRDRFIDRRDACRSDSCISDAYVSRMREISDIMAKKK